MTQQNMPESSHAWYSFLKASRWAAVVPAAIVGLYVGKLIINVFLPWGLRSIIQPVPEALLHVARALYSPVAFTWVGVQVAPSQKRLTGYVLTAAWVVFYIGALIYAYAAHGDEIELVSGTGDWLYVIFNGLASLGGVFIAFFCTPRWAGEDTSVSNPG